MGAVAAVAKLFALLIAVATAAAAALIVVPAPTHRLALVAIAASEKSVLIAAVATVALPLAFLGSRRGRRLPAAVEGRWTPVDCRHRCHWTRTV